MKVMPLRLPPGADLRQALGAWMGEQQEHRRNSGHGDPQRAGDPQPLGQPLARWRPPAHRYGRPPSCRSRLSQSGDRPQGLQQIR